MQIIALLPGVSTRSFNQFQKKTALHTKLESFVFQGGK